LDAFDDRHPGHTIATASDLGSGFPSSEFAGPQRFILVKMEDTMSESELSDEALDELHCGKACYCWANAKSDHRTTGC
jgi:hypothetical protein